jgi:hypothetical protein
VLKFRPRPLLVIVSLALAFSALAVTVIAFVPLPKTVIRRAAEASADWMLTDYFHDHGVTGRLRAAERKLLVSYVETGVAAALASEIEKSARSTDELDRIEATMRTLDALVLNQCQVRHKAHDWPVVISGFGACDQVNGVACRVLSHWFPRSELIALQDPATGTSPHTIGRVWSRRRGEWLYFDMFFETGVVYRRDRRGRIEMLRTVETKDAERCTPYDGLYLLGGVAFNEYHPTFAGYLAWKAQQALTRRTTASIIAPAPSSSAAKSAETRINDALFREVARRYMTARMEHLFGTHDRALAGYRAVASDVTASDDWRAAELANAAQHFAAILGRGGR